MKSLLSRFIKRERVTEVAVPMPEVLAYSSAIAPTQPFAAIGDVHGRQDLLAALVGKIERDAPGQPLLLVGDLVDRGPESAEVLRYVKSLNETRAQTVVLKGNHEQMLLDFIDDPAGRGLRWIDFGGRETMQSFGVEAPAPKAELEDIAEAALELEAKMGRELVAWLRSLPTRWQNGNVFCVHAALDPARKPGDQSDRSVLWGHADFFTKTRQDGLWVLHGHTIFAEAHAHSGRIACDTGAYQTDKLTAALVGHGPAENAVRFLTA